MCEIGKTLESRKKQTEQFIYFAARVRMSKRVNFAEFGIVEPHARLKHLANHGNLSDIDLNIPIRRYE